MSFITLRKKYACKFLTIKREWGMLGRWVGGQMSGFLTQQILFKMMLKDILDTFQFSCSPAYNSVTPWTAAWQYTLSITNTRTLLKLMCIESVMPSNHLIHYHPLLPLPSIFLSIRVFSNELAFHKRWPKYWGFSLSISPSSEYSGLISFRIKWLDLLAVWGTFKSLLQHYSSKASILQCSAFFIVQLSAHTWPLEKPYLWLDRSLSAK